MVKRNPQIAKLRSGYLFPEINRRKQVFLAQNPNVKLISLGIGDTTLPISHTVSERLKQYANALSTPEGYSGYGAEQGQIALRAEIAQKLYHSQLDQSEIFISDGAKCDLGRLQMMFGSQTTIALQDPTYPVYADMGVIMGQTGTYNDQSEGYQGITYMSCTKENDFFPDLKNTPRTDLIFFCSPNNPTGSTATRKQLEELVAFAQRNRSIIIYDAAYSMYINDPTLPKSIYEIEGAKKVAIEIGSFSKIAGFTGLRLGWSVIPKALQFEDGSSVWHDWHRINTTAFNGASNIVQQGGLAALSNAGMQDMQLMISFYMENAKIIKEGLESLGIFTTGGMHAPYIWAYFGGDSWEVFEELLQNAHVIVTPGSGFGPAGQGYIRFSPFGSQQDTKMALERIANVVSGMETKR